MADQPAKQEAGPAALAAEAPHPAEAAVAVTATAAGVAKAAAADAPDPAEAVPEAGEEAHTHEEVPDPDEDDLSDLDDVLDEFAATKLDARPGPAASGPGRPAAGKPSDARDAAPPALPPLTTLSLLPEHKKAEQSASQPSPAPPTAPPPSAVPATATAATAAPDAGLPRGMDGGEPGAGIDDDADFVRALQAGMADLLGELETSPEMAKQFEDMMRELGVAGGPGLAAAAAAAAPADAVTQENASAPAQRGADEKRAAEAKAKAGPAPAENGAPPRAEEPAVPFQESIMRTMERMRESGEAAGAAAAGAAGQGGAGAAGGAGGGDDADLMAALLREMEGGGDGSEEDFSKMLLGMMEQLTNKEILYEPMKELNDKYPEWMVKNRDKVPEPDLKRYEEQQKLVKEIVGKFEEEGYSDDNVESRQYIVDRMQQMQAAGSPPAELVGDMDAAQEAMGDLEGGCPTQ